MDFYLMFPIVTLKGQILIISPVFQHRVNNIKGGKFDRLSAL